MKWVLFIIVVVFILVLFKNKKKQISSDYEKEATTPGKATYLRDNYPILVAFIESLNDYQVEFERSDLIRYANNSDSIKKKIVVQQSIETISVVLVLENVVLKEWHLKKRDYTDAQMVEAVRAYLMNKA